MIVRIVRLTFRPEHVEDFLHIFEESKRLIRGSDGCHGVRLMRDVQQHNVFFTVSEWQSEAHLERYRESELFRSTWARTKVLFAAPPVAHSTVDTGF
jgi:quinol monooxygenase YgiN